MFRFLLKADGHGVYFLKIMYGMKDLPDGHYDYTKAWSLTQAKQQLEECRAEGKIPLFELASDKNTRIAYRMFLRDGILDWLDSQPDDVYLDDDILEFCCNVLEETEKL